MQNKVLRTHPSRIVAIVGGSGAGKSWLAAELQRRLGKDSLRLSLDDFYRDRSDLSLRQREKINFDHPRAINWAALEKVLKKLSKRQPAVVPRYDFSTHTRTAEKNLLKPKSIVLLDGLWVLLRRTIRRFIDFTIYLDCPERVRLQRRLARDLEERDRSVASIRHQFFSTVVPMHKKFVAPQMHRAHVIFHHDPKPGEISHLTSMIAHLAKTL